MVELRYYWRGQDTNGGAVKMEQLKPKQERFAQLYVELGSAAEAYRRAYDSEGKPESVHVAASRLLSDNKVSLRVAELREELAEACLWTRVDSISILADIARGNDSEAKTSDRVSAVKEINSMFGWKRQEVKHSGQIEQPLIVVLDGDDEGDE